MSDSHGDNIHLPVRQLAQRLIKGLEFMLEMTAELQDVGWTYYDIDDYSQGSEQNFSDSIDDLYYTEVIMPKEVTDGPEYP